MEPLDRYNLDVQRQRLDQLVAQISHQEAQLKRLKALRELAKQQTAINAELNGQLNTVNKSINDKDGELRQALNRVDNLNRKLNSHTQRRTRTSRTSGASDSEQSENKEEDSSSNGTVQAIGSNGRRVSFDPLALFLDAALEGELDLLIQTSKQVPDLNASHEECVTALHNATVAGHYNVAKYLIEAGCDINKQDSGGWTPLHCAASGNNLPLVKLLIENGALVYAIERKDQCTPAMKCQEGEEGYKECHKYLSSVQNNLGVINNGKVYALYDYTAKREDELSFKTGDELTILRRDDSDEQEWWWAQKRADEQSDSETVVDIKEGYIPRNLVGLHPRHEAYLKNKNNKQHVNNGNSAAPINSR